MAVGGEQKSEVKEKAKDLMEAHLWEENYWTSWSEEKKQEHILDLLFVMSVLYLRAVEHMQLFYFSFLRNSKIT